VSHFDPLDAPLYQNVMECGINLSRSLDRNSGVSFLKHLQMPQGQRVESR
jgi:hypothetical protein